MPRSRDLAIFVPTTDRRQTDRQDKPIALPLLRMCIRVPFHLVHQFSSWSRFAHIVIYMYCTNHEIPITYRLPVVVAYTDLDRIIT
jgi:hypothetical protein